MLLIVSGRLDGVLVRRGGSNNIAKYYNTFEILQYFLQYVFQFFWNFSILFIIFSKFCNTYFNTLKVLQYFLQYFLQHFYIFQYFLQYFHFLQ